MSTFGVSLTAALIFGALPAAGEGGQGIAIGQMVANMQSERAEAKVEADCRAGAPAKAATQTKVQARMALVMAAYFALTPNSSPSALDRVFAMRSRMLRLRYDNGPITVDQLGQHLHTPAAPPVLTSAAVGGDGFSGRELWAAPVATLKGEPTVYAVDFTTETGHFFDYASGIRILHLSVSPASQAPPAPGAFCHLDLEHGY